MLIILQLFILRKCLNTNFVFNKIVSIIREGRKERFASSILFASYGDIKAFFLLSFAIL